MVFFVGYFEDTDAHHLVNFGGNIQKDMENHHVSMGKLTISTGPFSIVMLNYQRVTNCMDLQT